MCSEKDTKQTKLQIKITDMLMDFEILMKNGEVYNFVQHM
jgi:hypothetical protein